MDQFIRKNRKVLVIAIAVLGFPMALVNLLSGSILGILGALSLLGFTISLLLQVLSW